MGPTDILKPSPPMPGDEAATAGKKLSVDEIEQAIEKVNQGQGQGSGRVERMPMGYGSAATRGYGR